MKREAGGLGEFLFARRAKPPVRILWGLLCLVMSVEPGTRTLHSECRLWYLKHPGIQVDRGSWGWPVSFSKVNARCHDQQHTPQQNSMGFRVAWSMYNTCNFYSEADAGTPKPGLLNTRSSNICVLL
jgi:hypothetical protein